MRNAELYERTAGITILIIGKLMGKPERRNDNEMHEMRQ